MKDIADFNIPEPDNYTLSKCDKYMINELYDKPIVVTEFWIESSNRYTRDDSKYAVVVFYFTDDADKKPSYFFTNRRAIMSQLMYIERINDGTALPFTCFVKKKSKAKTCLASIKELS